MTSIIQSVPAIIHSRSVIGLLCNCSGFVFLQTERKQAGLVLIGTAMHRKLHRHFFAPQKKAHEGRARINLNLNY